MTIDVDAVYENGVLKLKEHVAAAAALGATELVTVEKPSRSIHHARSVKVVTIHPNVRYACLACRFRPSKRRPGRLRFRPRSGDRESLNSAANPLGITTRPWS